MMHRLMRWAVMLGVAFGALAACSEQGAEADKTHAANASDHFLSGQAKALEKARAVQKTLDEAAQARSQEIERQSR